METTKYLKELDKQGKLLGLLKRLGIQEKTFIGGQTWLNMRWAENALRIEERTTYDISDGARVDAVYKLNDFDLVLGPDKKGPVLEKLKCLYAYMNKHFPSYQEDCLAYLNAQQEKRFAELDKKYAQAQDLIKRETKIKTDLAQGLYK